MGLKSKNEIADQVRNDGLWSIPLQPY